MSLVGKSDSTGSVRYLIDPLTKAILATYDAGTFLRLFNYNQNPQKIDEVFSYKTAQADKYYPHTDMLGSVYALSDSTGTSQASWTYDVYGTRTQTSGTLVYAFGYTGREHDGDTGLIYSRQRYYDPSVGQWLSKDQAGYLSGPNLYQYCMNNPTRFVDLLGLYPVTSDDVDLLAQVFEGMYSYWIALYSPTNGYWANFADWLANSLGQPPSYPPLPGSQNQIACGGYVISLINAFQQFLDIEFVGQDWRTFNISIQGKDQPGGIAGTVHTTLLVILATDDHSYSETIEFDPWKQSAPVESISQ